jgi:hypothetical protein
MIGVCDLERAHWSPGYLCNRRHGQSLIHITLIPANTDMALESC